MKTNYLELEKINQKCFYDTIQAEYLKVTEKYPVDFSKEFEVTGEVLFNNRLVKGVFWHSNKGSMFYLSTVTYDIYLSPNSLRSFPTRVEAQEWLKKSKSENFTDKSKVKIKKSFSNTDDRNWVSEQLKMKYFNRVLEFKKTTVKVLKWYE